jgi:serine phosphatase RsbU (regulator of sigma subunit)
LGLFEKSVYPTSRCVVSPEDSLVLFTDGLYEMAGPGDEEFGRARLLAEVRQRLTLPTARLFEEVLAEVGRFGKGNAFDDDDCLVGVELAARHDGQSSSNQQ